MSKFDRRVIPLCALTLLAVPHPAVVVHSVDGAAAAVAEQIDIDAGHRAPMARKASRMVVSAASNAETPGKCGFAPSELRGV